MTYKCRTYSQAWHLPSFQNSSSTSIFHYLKSTFPVLVNRARQQNFEWFRMIKMGSKLILVSCVSSGVNTKALSLLLWSCYLLTIAFSCCRSYFSLLQFPNLKSALQCCSDHSPSILTTDICPIPKSLLLCVSLTPLFFFIWTVISRSRNFSSRCFS